MKRKSYRVMQRAVFEALEDRQYCSSVLYPSGATAVDTGATYTLALSAKLPAGQDISSWTIVWGHGEAVQTINGDPSSATHVYVHSGSYAIEAYAHDQQGLLWAYGPNVSVAPGVAPSTVSGSGSDTGVTGSAYTLNLMASVPTNDPVIQWTITWGPGEAVQTLSGDISSVTHVYSHSGDYPIEVYANNSAGMLWAYGPTVAISSSTPAPAIETTPVVTASGAATATTGSNYTLNLSTSPDPTDPITGWSINWGDGSAAQVVTGNPSSVTHTFSAAGNYSVIASATNQLGTFSAAASPVTVSQPAPPPQPQLAPPAPSSTDPQAVITVTGSGAIAGETTFVQGVNSVLGDGSPITSTYSWNFGDPSGQYNTLVGFNAAHVYNSAGTYTITLTVTNDLGESSVATTTVNIAADNRPTIYVSSSTGNDANNGLTPQTAIASVNRLNQLLGNDMRVMFRAGDTFKVSTGVDVDGYHDVLIGSYGSGASPVLMYDGPGGYNAIIVTQPGSMNVMVQDLTFNSIYNVPSYSNDKAPFAFEPMGTNLAIRDCVFLNICDDVHAASNPDNLLVQDNSSPLVNGLTGYFLYGTGNNFVVLGNSVTNSVYQVALRYEDVNDSLIAYNTFNNVADTGKNSITLHWGSYAYVADNTLPTGPVMIGPNSGAGIPVPTVTQEWNWAVFDSNTIGTVLMFNPGSAGIAAYNNVFLNAPMGEAIEANGYDASWNRSLSDIIIDHNTVVSTADNTALLRVNGVINGITLDYNLEVDPNLYSGVNSAANVYVNDSSMEDFTQIMGNVWAVPAQSGQWAHNGEFWVGLTWGESSGYLSLAQWNALPAVSDDSAQNVTLTNSYGEMYHSAWVGSDLPLSGS